MASDSEDLETPPARDPAERTRIAELHRELGDEHGRIMALIDRLEGGASVAQIAPLLDELHTLLINHFAREQFPGGLYEALARLGAAHHDELRVLVREHCEILSALRAALEHSRAATGAQVSEVRAEAGAVIASVRAHEHREHALTSKLLPG